MKALDLLPRGEDKRKESLMRNTRVTAGLLTLSLLLVGSAVAGNTNKGTLKFDETITVGGKQLPAGKYEVEWAGTGPDVELSITNSKGTVAKVPAQILPLQKAGAGTGYSTDTDQAGNKALAGIFFGGKKYELSIGGASAANATSSDKSRGSN
jgi:hypothetical protein